MTPAEFAALVEQMRLAQREFFRTQSAASMRRWPRFAKTSGNAGCSSEEAPIPPISLAARTSPV